MKTTAVIASCPKRTKHEEHEWFTPGGLRRRCLGVDPDQPSQFEQPGSAW